LECFQFEEFAGLKERNIKYLRKHYVLKVGKLYVIHGHEYGMNPWGLYPHPGFTMYNRTKCDCMSGHIHRKDTYQDPRGLSGEGHIHYLVGCLCSLHPEYASAPFNKWTHGYARGEVDQDGNFYVDNVEILL